MNILIKSLGIDTESVDIGLDIRIVVDFFRDLEIPISISGKILLGNKVISVINDLTFANGTSTYLQLKTQGQKQEIFANVSGSAHEIIDATAYLSPKAIEYMERYKESHFEKSVILNLQFTVKYLEIPSFSDVQTGFAPSDFKLCLISRIIKGDHVIKHSDWVNTFSEPLGIGRFILVEMAVPEMEDVTEYWKPLYAKAYACIEDMEEEIRKGEWKAVMYAARRFFENIKTGDPKSKSKPFEELKKLFFADDHTEESFTNFTSGIFSFFEYASKFLHDKNKQQQFQNMPNPTKEDAYFVFALSSNLLNVIAKKIGEKNAKMLDNI